MAPWPIYSQFARRFNNNAGPQYRQSYAHDQELDRRAVATASLFKIRTFRHHARDLRHIGRVIRFIGRIGVSVSLLALALLLQEFTAPLDT